MMLGCLQWKLKAESCIFGRSDLSQTQKVVLASMIRESGRGLGDEMLMYGAGMEQPVHSLGVLIRLSVPTVRRAIKILVAKKYIKPFMDDRFFHQC